MLKEICFAYGMVLADRKLSVHFENQKICKNHLCLDIIITRTTLGLFGWSLNFWHQSLEGSGYNNDYYCE